MNSAPADLRDDLQCRTSRRLEPARLAGDPHPAHLVGDDVAVADHEGRDLHEQRRQLQPLRGRAAGRAARWSRRAGWRRRRRACPWRGRSRRPSSPDSLSDEPEHVAPASPWRDERHAAPRRARTAPRSAAAAAEPGRDPGDARPPPRAARAYDAERPEPPRAASRRRRGRRRRRRRACTCGGSRWTGECAVPVERCARGRAPTLSRRSRSRRSCASCASGGRRSDQPDADASDDGDADADRRPARPPESRASSMPLTP